MSLLVLQKTLFHVVICAGFLLVFLLWNRRPIRLFLPFLYGGLVAGLLLLGWGIGTGNMSMLLYSLIKVPMEVSNVSKMFAIPPLNYFYFNDIYYGISGWNWGFILNRILWIAGLAVCAIRFVWSLFHISKKETLPDLLITTLCIVQTLTFIFMMPAKHAQYLIPLAVFVVFYVADAIDFVWLQAKKAVFTRMLFAVGIGVFLFLCIRGYHDTTDVKYLWYNGGNQDEIQMLQTMLRTIPTTEYVFDMVGVSMYYPQPYVLSNAPGQILFFLSRPLPTIASSLIATDTKYIYQGSAKRITTFREEDQHYMNEHFTPVGDGSLLVRNDVVDSFRERWSR